MERTDGALMKEWDWIPSDQEENAMWLRVVFSAAVLFSSVPLACAFRTPNRAEIPPVHVLVWDEQQARQKEAYQDFLGNQIAEALRLHPGIDVRSVKLDDPEQGLSEANLEWTQVLIWWGHVRQSEIKPAASAKIVERIKAGKLSLVALHSAHWSEPFMAAMNERTKQDVRTRYPDPDTRIEYIPVPGRFPPASDSMLTPAYYALKRGGKIGSVRVDLPNCCFPDYRPDGAPSTMTVLLPEHPLAVGLSKTFTIPHTEMYNEPFHVPEPDEVVFRENWERGEWFRSGMVWNLGEGKIFYFRPGHETFDVYHQTETLQILENAVRWLGLQYREK